MSIARIGHNCDVHPGDVTVSFLATENIAKFDLVTSEGKRVNTSNPNTRNKIIGFATSNVSSGFYGAALGAGVITNPIWSFSSGDRIFANGVGSVSNSAPGSTYVQLVGTALNAKTINIQIHQATLL